MITGSSEEAEVLQYVAKQAKLHLNANRVILFGSRARGDADERSDFDIAIDAPPESTEKFFLLRQDLENTSLTLLSFDIIDINTASKQLRDRILTEGRELSDKS